MTTADKPKVDLNLDSLKRETERPDPFSFVLAGKRYVMGDAEDAEWGELAELDEEDVIGQVRLLLGDSFDEFRKAKLPQWKLNQLMHSYRKHYGIPMPGEQGGSTGS